MIANIQTASAVANMQADHRRLDRLIETCRTAIESGEMKGAAESISELRNDLTRHIKISEGLIFPWFEAATGLDPVNVPPSIMGHDNAADIRLLSLIQNMFAEAMLRPAAFERFRPALVALLITERRQLERAKAEATVLADLNRRKDEFLAMLSHELRNPLAPIMNALELLRTEHGTENPLQQQARVIIERQVGHLSYLVDDLLEVSRITSGRIRLHEEDVDLRGVAERAMESVRPLIDQRRQQLAMVLSPQPVWVHGDPARLEQVACNLLNNAAKYTEQGGRIDVDVSQEEARAVLRVTDTGVGIAPEFLPRIFDLFTQSERSLDRSQGGLGIGLWLVRRLVRLHRGTVEVSSRMGEGSRFTVNLPLLQAPTSRPQEASRTTVSTAAHPLSVLVVDDSIDQADSVAMLLRMSGHDVRVAYASPAALDAAVNYTPDVVLMDIGLPGMDGYEVARRLRKHSKLKDVWLIAMTGYGRESDRQRSRNAGFDYHMLKPIHPHKLEELLSTLSRMTHPAV